MTPSAALPPLEYGPRTERLRATFDELGCEAFVVTDLANIRYLTGFTGSNATLVVLECDLVLITDGRYRDQAADQLAAAGVDAAIEITREPTPWIAEAVAGAYRTGVEADDITWAQQRSWAEQLPSELVATTGAIVSLRAVKDAGEVARLRRASEIADAALADVRLRLVEGLTEREFARALENAMLDHGADGPSFETIVASGPNSARPHARPSDRRIGSSAEGELVVVDFGALFDGYHSDMTRTFGVGGLTKAQHELVLVVSSAQAAGVAAVRSGIPASEIDATCRDHIEASGHGDAFLHPTGHGIGLVIHEHPRVSATSTDVLESGQCVTVEPGVYLPGVGGVRIEDSVVVADQGCEFLTGSSYDLVP